MARRFSLPNTLLTASWSALSAVVLACSKTPAGGSDHAPEPSAAGAFRVTQSSAAPKNSSPQQEHPGEKLTHDSAAARSKPDARLRAAGHTRPVAVVELFTSEGCSSCPTADLTLAAIELDRRRAKQNVISLAFHVDYWNRLGWTDRFSDRAYSDRQRWYALREAEPRVYTPQMVVQGHEHFIGSHRDQAERAIDSALSTPASVSVSLTAEPTADHTWHVEYVIDGARAKDHLSFALVRDQATTEVQSGENAGRTLSHVSIVVDYAKRAVGSARGSWQPTFENRAPVAVVALVQAEKGYRVLGAQHLRLKP